MELTKTKFKQTEIGLIPEDWDIKNVGACFEICNNLRLPISQEVRKSMQGIYPYYGPTKIQDYINEYRVDGEYALIGEDGDHFLKWYTHSMTQLASGKFNVNNHAHLIKGNDKETTTAWFYYFFKNRDITQFLTRQGAGRYKLSKAGLSNLPCAYPEIEEQKAIALVLSDTDNLIQTIEKKLTKKRAIKQGAMQQLLTPKEDWEVKKLGEVSKINKGEQLNRDTLSEIGAYPVINGGVLPSGFTHNWNKKANTITISEGGNSCGYVNFLKTNFWQGGHCYSIDTDYQLDYMFHFLKFNEKNIMKLRVGSGLPNIQRKRLSTFEVFIPQTKQEQTEIATILSDMDTEIEQLEKKLSKYKMLKQGLMQNLLTGKIRLV